MRRQRHALLAAGDDDRVVAERDVLGAERDGAQARAADLVDAPGGALLRQAGVDVRLAGRVLALAGGQHLAEDRLARPPPASTPARSSTALITAAPSSCAGVLAKAPLKLPTARARGRCDDDVGHRSPLLGGRGSGSGRRAAIRRTNRRGRVRPALVAQRPGGSTGWARRGRRGTPPIGRQTWRARQAADDHADMAGRAAAALRAPRDRRGRAAAASGGGAIVSRCAADDERRRARSRRGSTGAAEEAPARRWRSGCGSASRPAGRVAAPAGIGTPSASQSSSATNSRAAGALGVEPRELLELQRRLHRVDQREEHLEHRDRHQAEGLAEAVEQPLGARRAARRGASRGCRRRCRGSRRSPRARRW